MGVRDSRLLRLTPPPADNRPVIVGSDLHISMGAAEFAGVRTTSAALDIELTGAGATNGSIFFHAAGNWTLAGFKGMAHAELTQLAPAIWRMELQGRRRGEPQSVSLTADM